MKSAGYAVKRAPRWSEASSTDSMTPRILVLLTLASNLHLEALKQSDSLKPVLGNEKRKQTAGGAMARRVHDKTCPRPSNGASSLGDRSP